MSRNRPPTKKEMEKVASDEDEEKAPRPQHPLSTARRNRRINRVVWKIFFITLLVLTVFLEFREDINGYLIPLLCTALLGFIGILFKNIWGTCKERINCSDSEIDFTWIALGKVLWNVILSMLKNPGLRGAVIVFVGISLSSILAYAKITGSVLNLVDPKVAILKENAKNSKDVPESISPDKKNPEDTEGEKPKTGNEEPIQNAAASPSIKLTQQEKDELYFLSGDFSIEGLDDASQVMSKIKEFIDDKMSRKRDDDPITSLFEIKTQEANLVEKEIVNLSDVLIVIDLHIFAWNEAHTLILSRLLSHDYHRAALMVKTKPWDNEIGQEYEYYLYKSIHWGIANLEFAGTDSNSQIHWIHTRYRELRDAGIEKSNSTALEAAFRSLCKEKECMSEIIDE